MFVTILTIIYLALALFILVRFCKQSVHIGHWSKGLCSKVNQIFERKSDIDESRIEKSVVNTSDIKKEHYQPELRSS